MSQFFITANPPIDVLSYASGNSPQHYVFDNHYCFVVSVL